tara:strand:+ start:158 stop:511 length:354 start_codon:yes stop_codon:yes gene_type:complete
MAQPSPIIVSAINSGDEKPKISHLPALFFIILGLILMFTYGSYETIIEDFAACFAGIISIGLGLTIESFNLGKMKTWKSKKGESTTSENLGQATILTVLLLIIVLPILAYYVLLSMA